MEIQSQVSKDRSDLSLSIPLSTPYVVYIEPSGYCNLKCNFCMHGYDEEFKRGLMPVSRFKRIIKQIGDFREKVKLLRVCGNGDPLMNKNIIEMLSYVSEKGDNIDRVEMVTNGVLLNDNLVMELPKYLNRIIISVEGISENDYLKVAGNKIDFDKFVKSVSYLYENRQKCRIHIKIHDKAVDDECKKKQFFSLFGGISDEIYIENLVPMWPELDIGVEQEEFRYGGGEPLVKKKVCAQIFKGMQIQAEGEVVPCCVDWKRINVIGNIDTSTALDIWNSNELRNLQNQHLSGRKNLLEPCRSCTMNDYCEVDNIDALL